MYWVEDRAYLVNIKPTAGLEVLEQFRAAQRCVRLSRVQLCVQFGFKGFSVSSCKPFRETKRALALHVHVLQLGKGIGAAILLIWIALCS